MKNEDQAASNLCSNGRQFHGHTLGNDNVRSFLSYLHSTRSLQTGLAAVRIEGLNS